jgi:hypothetical protein
MLRFMTRQYFDAPKTCKSRIMQFSDHCLCAISIRRSTVRECVKFVRYVTYSYRTSVSFAILIFHVLSDRMYTDDYVLSMTTSIS